MKLYSFIAPLVFGFIISVLTVSFSTQKVDTPQIMSGSIEGVGIVAPKSRAVRGGGLYGRPAPSTAQSSSVDSILVVIKNSSSNSQTTEPVQYLNQEDQQFVPSLLPVHVGGTVRIQNSDPVYHNVFSLTSPHKFDVGRRPKGEHFDVDFEKPGVIDVFCDIHSNMHAIIYVLPPGTEDWRKIKSGDSFSFTNVPDGEYELSLYALGYTEVTSQIIVRDGETYQAGTITLNQ